jgi:UDP-perosamine 4-acetyltransferase
MKSVQSPKPLVLIGAGGHAKVLLSLIQDLGLSVFGVCAPELLASGVLYWRGVRVLPILESELLSSYGLDVDLVNAVGDLRLRQRLFVDLTRQGYSFPTLIHSKSVVDATVRIGQGVQIMAGVVIQVDACIGDNVIVNTSVSIDHDCIIENHVHIAPKAMLCGNVDVGEGAFIASGVSVAQNIRIGRYAVAGLGVSVVRDVPAYQVVMPAAVRYGIPKEKQ